MPRVALARTPGLHFIFFRTIYRTNEEGYDQFDHIWATPGHCSFQQHSWQNFPVLCPASARKPLSDESRSDDQGAGRNDTASPYNPSSQGIRPSADSAIFPIFRLLCTIFLEALIPEAINSGQTSVKRRPRLRRGQPSNFTVYYHFIDSKTTGMLRKVIMWISFTSKYSSFPIYSPWGEGRDFVQLRLDKQSGGNNTAPKRRGPSVKIGI